MENWKKFRNLVIIWKLGKDLEIGKKFEVWKKDCKFGKKLKIWKIFGNLKK